MSTPVIRVVSDRVKTHGIYRSRVVTVRVGQKTFTFNTDAYYNVHDAYSVDGFAKLTPAMREEVLNAISERGFRARGVKPNGRAAAPAVPELPGIAQWTPYTSGVSEPPYTNSYELSLRQVPAFVGTFAEQGKITLHASADGRGYLRGYYVTAQDVDPARPGESWITKGGAYGKALHFVGSPEAAVALANLYVQKVYARVMGGVMATAWRVGTTGGEVYAVTKAVRPVEVTKGKRVKEPFVRVTLFPGETLRMRHGTQYMASAVRRDVLIVNHAATDRAVQRAATLQVIETLYPVQAVDVEEQPVARTERMFSAYNIPHGRDTHTVIFDSTRLHKPNRLVECARQDDDFNRYVGAEADLHGTTYALRGCDNRPGPHGERTLNALPRGATRSAALPKRVIRDAAYQRPGAVRLADGRVGAKPRGRKGHKGRTARKGR